MIELLSFRKQCELILYKYFNKLLYLLNIINGSVCMYPYDHTYTYSCFRDFTKKKFNLKQRRLHMFHLLVEDNL